MTWVVYGLRNVGSTELRYVGQTKHSGNYRLTFERSLARKRLNLNAAIRYQPNHAHWITGGDGPVEAITLGTCETEAEARRREREMIGACLAMGHRLFNRQHVPIQLSTLEAIEPWQPRQVAA